MELDEFEKTLRQHFESVAEQERDTPLKKLWRIVESDFKESDFRIHKSSAHKSDSFAPNGNSFRFLAIYAKTTGVTNTADQPLLEITDNRDGSFSVNTNGSEPRNQKSRLETIEALAEFHGSYASEAPEPFSNEESKRPTGPTSDPDTERQTARSPAPSYRYAGGGTMGA